MELWYIIFFTNNHRHAPSIQFNKMNLKILKYIIKSPNRVVGYFKPMDNKWNITKIKYPM
jgi:hypothetical protein